MNLNCLAYPLGIGTGVWDELLSSRPSRKAVNTCSGSKSFPK
jgi:hypothetical protein